MSFGSVPQAAILPGGEINALIRIVALLDRAEPAVRRRFLELLDSVDSLDSLEQIATFLERGDIAGALRVTNQIAPALSTTLESAYRAAGLSAAEVLRSQVDTMLEFNTLNQRAQDALAENRARFIREFDRAQRESTLEFLDDALRRGLAPIEQARELKRSIGLTRRQAQSVLNYRRLLEQGSSEALTRRLRDRRFDRSVAAAIRGDRALTRDQIDRMVERYRQRMIAFRARTIARTESLRAINEADEELWNQAIDAGVIRAEDVSNVWHTARDERVRPSHMAMDGQARAFGQPFESGLGNLLRFPGDPFAPANDVINCRCVVARNLKRVAQAA